MEIGETVKLTNLGVATLSEFLIESGQPTQKEIEKRGCVNSKTTRKIMKKKPVKLLSVFRLLTTISVIGDKKCPTFLPNLHYKSN